MLVCLVLLVPRQQALLSIAHGPHHTRSASTAAYLSITNCPHPHPITLTTCVTYSLFTSVAVLLGHQEDIDDLLGHPPTMMAFCNIICISLIIVATKYRVVSKCKILKHTNMKLTENSNKQIYLLTPPFLPCCFLSDNQSLD